MLGFPRLGFPKLKASLAGIPLTMATGKAHARVPTWYFDVQVFYELPGFGVYDLGC